MISERPLRQKCVCNGGSRPFLFAAISLVILAARGAGRMKWRRRRKDPRFLLLTVSKPSFLVLVLVPLRWSILSPRCQRPCPRKKEHQTNDEADLNGTGNGATVGNDMAGHRPPRRSNRLQTGSLILCSLSFVAHKGIYCGNRAKVG